MNKFRLTPAVCFVALAAMLAGAQSQKAHSAVIEQSAVDYHQYESYFEKNNSGLKGTVSYLVITRQREFDRIFGAAATATNNDFLPEGAFKTRLVVATIKRGNSIREYKVKQVTANKGKLFVWYDTEDRSQGDATYSSPLILSVAKGNYREVVFMENGKRAGAVRLKK
ncbi:MAG TPA: hypothetical protein VM095_16805 [Pyrinomonadaceae bacterium]|nr:hypothetical protein [Pyrinomonadaceae bacterium]